MPAEPRVHPVGRLDMDTEGLLLLTNDGVLTHRLTHPSFGVEKEYVAEVEGRPGRGVLRLLREGVELDDGMTAPAKVSELQPGVLRLTIHEGRNRQVRRMCEAVGHPVVRLVRTRIGPLRDPHLAPGEWRELTLDDDIRRSVRFVRANLAADEPELLAAGAFDVIFCRNILMYFTPDHARAAVARLARALVPEGHLFLGSAETLRGVSDDFHLRHSHGAFYYQRKSERERPPPAPERFEPPLASTTGGDWALAIERA